MRSRHYTEEIGVVARERPVPAAVAFLVVALVLVVAGWFVRQVLTHPTASGDAAATPAAPTKVAQR